MLKKKKSLAFVLAMVMMLTLIPASAFATTSNSVTKAPTVAAETAMPSVQLDLTVTGAKGFTSSEQAIRLTLENGEWNSKDNADDSNCVTSGSGMATTHAITVDKTSVSAIKVRALSDTTAEFSFTPDGIPKDGTVTLYLNIKSGADVGEVKVKVDGLDSEVSSGTYVAAIVGDGNTIATVPDKPKNVGRASITGSSIEVREVAVNSIAGSQLIKFTLPKGVTWNDMGTGSQSFGGNMASGSAVFEGDYIGERDVVVSFSAVNVDSTRELFTFKPSFKVGKDAAKGDIMIQLRNQLSGDNKIADASGLVVAVYGDETVTVTTVDDKKLPEILAGREYKSATTEYEVEVTLTENQTKALTLGRFVDFSFPDHVQLVSGQAVEVKINAETRKPIEGVKGKSTEDTSSFEWEVPTSLTQTKTNKVSFYMPITVEANYVGDIELTVDGAKAGVSETKIVVGKAIAPFTVEAAHSNVKTGVQNQVAGTITIKESVAGAIRDEAGLNEIIAWIDTNAQDFNFSDAKVEVKTGDLELKNKPLRFDKGNMYVGIERTSIKTPAEIVISDVQITLDRTPAQGKYALKVGGTAVVNNELYRDKDFDEAVTTTDYVTVVTPADQGVNATFKIGEKSYVSNGVTYTMDAAAYVDGANRTMVPIRYIANAMGVSEDQVIWNQGTQTATIFGKNMVSIKVGSNVITSNGTPITMDTVAVNISGRVYVPLRYVSYALGADVSWDQATQTATIFTVK